MRAITSLLLQILERLFGPHPPVQPEVVLPVRREPPPLQLTPAQMVIPTRAAPDPFRAAMDFILGPSRDGAKKDSAPGETFATNQGVTAMTWAEADRQGIVSGALEDMTDEQRDAIYRAMFWNHLGCPGLNPGVALMVFNDGVLSGTGHTAKLLQRLVGAPEDGMVGPVTTKLADDMSPHDLIDSLVQADTEYLKSLKSAPMFIGGWMRREHECALLAGAIA